jgi:hypothetical protein
VKGIPNPAQMLKMVANLTAQTIVLSALARFGIDTVSHERGLPAKPRQPRERSPCTVERIDATSSAALLRAGILIFFIFFRGLQAHPFDRVIIVGRPIVAAAAFRGGITRWKASPHAVRLISVWRRWMTVQPRNHRRVTAFAGVA